MLLLLALPLLLLPLRLAAAMPPSLPPFLAEMP